jgi:hypothetical protein
MHQTLPHGGALEASFAFADFDVTAYEVSTNVAIGRAAIMAAASVALRNTRNSSALTRNLVGWLGLAGLN